MVFKITKKEELYQALDKVETNSKLVSEIVETIIKPYCKDLDNYVGFIRACLKDGEHPVTDSELDDFCLNLATYIYSAGGVCEYIGIKDDISKAFYKEQFNLARSQEKGTIADKDSAAELLAQKEQIVNICYNRAFKLLKSKVENAQELLASCKKVVSRRMQEYALTNLGGAEQ